MLPTLKAPLEEGVVTKLRAGDRVEVNGTIYTARDAAHRRLNELIENGAPLPFDLQGQIIYYMGPTPAPPGRVIGAAGPTTSSRMDIYTPALVSRGLRASIGKGKRSEQIKKLCCENLFVYLVALGGAGALLSQHIRNCRLLTYEDLGPEAVHILEVRRFPAVVCYDCHGGDLYEQGRKEWCV